MATLTVFTPTYNRAHTLLRTYESLCCQTIRDFCWLIVDDGSTDNTRELVAGWMESNTSFEIQYVYKDNGGLHTGYNKAAELMDSVLCVCIDSDDWMPADAVEKIIQYWRNNGGENVAGIIGLDFYQNDLPIGGFLPRIPRCHNYELSHKYHHVGDRKMIIRTDLLKSVTPQPTFYKEKNFNPMYSITKIDLKYEWLILNENLCYVEYQSSGMASNIYKQYKNSPNSFAAIRIQNFSIPDASKSFYLKQYIHLASSAIISGHLFWLSKAPNKFFSFLALPLGTILVIYIYYKAN